MSHALARTKSARRATPWLFGALVLTALAASASGFGATTSTQIVTTNVLGTISLTDPTAKLADPPVCTDAVAPLDTDDCGDVTYAAGSPNVLRLGALSGSDVQAGSLRWRVTTTASSGYRVRMSNAGAAPLMRGATTTIADMSTGPLVAATAVDDATHFGVALGDPVTDSEGSVSFAGSPWVNAGQQGELFSGIPTAGMVVAERLGPFSNDPFTATFAAASISSAPPAPGSYAGTVRVIASII